MKRNDPAVYQPIVPWTPMRAPGSDSDDPSAKQMATANEELRVPDLRIHSKTNPASQSYSSLAGSGGWWWWWWFFLWFEKLPWISYTRVVTFTCTLRPEWVTGWNVMLLHPCEMDVFNEGFVHLLHGFKDILMSWVRISSKEPVRGDFRCIRFLCQPCKIKLVRVEAVVCHRHVSCNCDSVLWCNSVIK